MENFDVIVIGGGPGGYVAAVRASQLGLKTALVEKESLGGTCLNWGCVPTKSLLRNAEVVHLLGQGRAMGFSFDNLTVDYAVAHKRSRSVVLRQTRRVAILMKNSGIPVYEGAARFIDANTVTVENSGKQLQAKHIIIATGARSRALPGADYDGEQIISFRRALEMTELPESALIVGAGPIGMEFATVWNRYGTRVTVVEMMPHALPLEDEEISIEAQKQFKKEGITVMTGAMVDSVRATDAGVDVTVKTGESVEILAVDTVLVSIGFVPNIDTLDLDKANVTAVRGAIEVDDAMRTNTPHIYAIGDVTAKLGLAHVASAQGVIAAEAIAGKQTAALNYINIPRCTYTHPEVASVGLTEQQATEQGYKVIAARCPFLANGKAMAMDDNSGFVKIVAEQKSKRLLGVHLLGSHVTELVAGATGMISLNADAMQLGEVVHPHPTLGEAIMEAAHKLCGHAIHI